MSSREISKAAYALEKIFGSDASDAGIQALHALAARATLHAETLDAQAVAKLLHAHGTLGSAPETARVMKLLQRRVAHLAMAGECTPQDIANVLWALAKLSSAAEPLLVSALDSIMPGMLPRFKPLEISSLAWSLAKAPLLPAEELSRLVTALHKTLDYSLLSEGLSAQGVANCLWAFARLEPPPSGVLVSELALQATNVRDSLTPQGLSNVCSACAKLWDPENTTFMFCLELLDEGSIDALGAPDVAEIAWAVGRMRQQFTAKGSPKCKPNVWRSWRPLCGAARPPWPRSSIGKSAANSLMPCAPFRSVTIPSSRCCHLHPTEPLQPSRASERRSRRPH